MRCNGEPLHVVYRGKKSAARGGEQSEHPGEDPGGIIVTILIGIAGAFVGGFVVGLFGGPAVTGFNFASILVAVLGAVILLVAYRVIARRAM